MSVRLSPGRAARLDHDLEAELEALSADSVNRPLLASYRHLLALCWPRYGRSVTLVSCALLSYQTRSIATHHREALAN